MPAVAAAVKTAGHITGKTTVMNFADPGLWASLLFGSTAAVFLAATLSALFHLQWARRLPPLAALPAASETGEGVWCSVVVAARDEDARIEETVRHVLAQTGVRVEMIVVDDRSTDRTGDILRRLAAADARVRIERVEALPDGWLGKCHACHVGAGRAAGEWILFTDADCWLKTDVVARALRVAARDAADHVTLTPGVAPETLGAKAWHLAFLASLANWFSGVNRDRPKAYLGVGAFNLVRAAAYRECGGYEALRLTVVDDMKLGRLLRRAGFRTRGFIGGDDVECHWGTTLRGMVKIMEKNYFAAIGFRLGVALAGGVVATVLLAAAAIGPFTGTATGAAAGLAALSMAIPAGVVARRLGWPVWTAAATPFIYPVLLYAVMNSTWVTVRQGGVRWRDTFYPLESLRKGGVP